MQGGGVPGEVTTWLERWAQGKPGALDQLTPLVYDQLHSLADSLLRGERSHHTLQPTALVNEAFQQLLKLHKVSLNDRSHFYTFAAKLMRRILTDHARRVKSAKRGAGFQRIPLDRELAWIQGLNEETLDLSSALDELESMDSANARAVELRYFLGCTIDETASLLGISPATVDRSIRFSLAWLQDRLHPPPG